MHNPDLTSALPDETPATSAVAPATDGGVGHAPGETWLVAATLLLSGGVILTHFCLVPGGGWGGDEFFNFALFQRYGLHWLVVRMLTWSPRPASDLVLYLYSLAVATWRMPLIAPFLGVLWALLIGSTVASAWQRGSAGLLPRLALALTVLAMFLLGHRVNELFYWPMGATPYLLDLLGITVVTFQVVAGGTSRPRARLACGLGLAIAATSSETGLFFALAFTAALLLLEFPILARQGIASLKGAAWYLLPLAISLAAAACLGSIVMLNPSRGIGQDSSYFHHFWPSLAATMLAVGPDMFRGDGSPAGLGSFASVLTMGLLFLGFLWACRSGLGAPAPRRYMAALLAGLLGCFVLTIFTTFYEYSERVHEPQAAFRKCLVVLGLLAVARLVEPHWTARWRLPRIIGPIALIGAVCIGMVARAPRLIGDYDLLPEIRKARAQTWQSGLDTETATLRYVVPPQGQVVHGLIPWPTGHFVLGAPGTEWWMTGLMEFFGKNGLEFAPPPANGAR